MRPYFDNNGTTTSASKFPFFNSRPKLAEPKQFSSTVTDGGVIPSNSMCVLDYRPIPGKLTITISGTTLTILPFGMTIPDANKVAVDFSTGRLQFHSSRAGATFSATLTGHNGTSFDVPTVDQIYSELMSIEDWSRRLGSHYGHMQSNLGLASGSGTIVSTVIDVNSIGPGSMPSAQALLDSNSNPYRFSINVSGQSTFRPALYDVRVSVLFQNNLNNPPSTVLPMHICMFRLSNDLVNFTDQWYAVDYPAQDIMPSSSDIKRSFWVSTIQARYRIWAAGPYPIGYSAGIYRGGTPIPNAGWPVADTVPFVNPSPSNTTYIVVEPRAGITGSVINNIYARVLGVSILEVN